MSLEQVGESLATENSLKENILIEYSYIPTLGKGKPPKYPGKFMIVFSKDSFVPCDPASNRRFDVRGQLLAPSKLRVIELELMRYNISKCDLEEKLYTQSGYFNEHGYVIYA